MHAPQAPPRLGVVAVGDPRGPRAWSGCPAALVPALERQGIEVVGIDAGVHGLALLPFAARYHGRRWWRSPRATKLDLGLQRDLLRPSVRADLHWDLRLRERRARAVVAEARAREVDTLLHCTPNAVPLEAPRGIRQLLYADATWTSHSWCRRPGGPGRHPASLVAEGAAHERRSYAHLDHVFVQGEWIVDEHLRLGVYAERLTAVGTGTSFDDEAAGLAPVPGRLLCVVKDLVDERGVPTVVDALRIARAQDPDVHLVLLGNEAAARRFGGEPGVEAHGYVPRAQLDAELDRASLLVQPASYMAWGMVFLEAMAARTPVVALDRFAMREITEDGALGYLVEEQDPGLVAAAVLDALSDERRLRKVGEEARRSVLRRFSWDGVAAKMAAVIRADGRVRP